jgi:Cdc6-like AAA superfamily ATPase
MALKYEIGRIFTPSAPISDSALFAGRRKQLDLLINAISQRGQHAALYGERGVGKTSLTRVIREFIGNTDFNLFTANCESKTTFDSLWETLLREMEAAEPGELDGTESDPENDDAPPIPPERPYEISPESIRHMLQRSNRPSLIIIDEMDRISDRPTKTRLADTIKTLSDHSVDATILLVGVADSISDLMAEHASIARALVQIPMPRMSISELRQIVTKGVERVHMTIEASALHRISSLSHGLPHYTHLLALHAAQAAVERGSETISTVDVSSAISSSITQAQHSVTKNYHDAIRSSRGNLYPQVLLACALAQTDELGYFTAASVREPLSKIMHKSYDIPAFAQHLKDFSSEKRGPVIQQVGSPRRYKFRFIDPLMEPYIVMKGISQRFIDHTMIDADDKAKRDPAEHDPNETLPLL